MNKNKYCHISVRNKSMPKELFDALCDSLSELRHWCSDYRLRNDFDPSKESPYWESYTYAINEELLIQAAFEGVVADAKSFCNKNFVDFDNAVEVKIIEHL